MPQMQQGSDKIEYELIARLPKAQPLPLIRWNVGRFRWQLVG
jgi:hypothetical protein